MPDIISSECITNLAELSLPEDHEANGYVRSFQIHNFCNDFFTDRGNTGRFMGIMQK